MENKNSKGGGRYTIEVRGPDSAYLRPCAAFIRRAGSRYAVGVGTGETVAQALATAVAEVRFRRSVGAWMDGAS